MGERSVVSVNENEYDAGYGAAAKDCNTCDGTGRWETTLEDSPNELTYLGPCPDCSMGLVVDAQQPKHLGFPILERQTKENNE